jgi:tetratricopeptide (TPR) repeat protein
MALVVRQVRACGAWFALLLLVTLGSRAAAADLTVLDDGSAGQLTALGNEALMQGRFETAIEQYHRALAADKQSFEALFNLALANQQLGKSDDAKHWYDEALKVSHDHPEVLCNLGYLAFRAKDYQQAVERFQDAAHLAISTPLDAADYWFNAGTARERLTQWDEARQAYEECLALNPQHYGGHFNLGTLYLGPLREAQGALEKATTHLTKARDQSPNRPEAWLNLALCHEQSASGDPEADYNQAIKIASPAQVDEALWQRAMFFNRLQPPRKVAMREDLTRILADNPTFPEANVMLGTYFFSIGDFDQAITHLEKEVDGPHFDPGNPTDLEAHYLLALIYTDHRPNPTKALQHATAYYQFRPDSAKIHDLRRRALRLSAGQPQ